MRYKILQLGTVMTAPEYRGRGLGRTIMEYIDRAYADADGIYLFGNDSVVDYYPKFGFRPGREMEYRKEVSLSGENRAVQVKMDGPAAWAQLADAMERSTFREGCKMVGNPELIFFYVSQFMQEAVFFLPHLDAWVIAEPEDGALTIHNIFADGAVTVDDVIRSFGAGVKTVSLGFAPADPDGWEIRELKEDDCNFFVKGGAFDEFEKLRLRIPSLSHA